MNRSRLQIQSGVWLDARRAVFLESESLLAVADLHYGYALAHRSRGQLMPLSAPEDTAERLLALAAEYQPKTIALLGDIVHDHVPLAEFRRDLAALFAQLESVATLHLIAGNHDRRLSGQITQPLPREISAGPYRLMHGDGYSLDAAKTLLDGVRTSGQMLLMGHEHPAIGIGDGIAHHARVPSFLVGDGLIVLPAFSPWAAGCDVRRGAYLSPFPTITDLRCTVAILAGKLLRIPWGR